MEQKRGRGREKGFTSHFKGVTGADCHLSKLWDLYQHGEFLGTYKGLEEISELINRSKMRCWQMAKGYNGNRKVNRPITSKEGFTVLAHGESWGWWLED